MQMRNTGVTVIEFDYDKLAKMSHDHYGYDTIMPGDFMRSGIIVNKSGTYRTINIEGVQDYPRKENGMVCVYTDFGYRDYWPTDLLLCLSDNTRDLSQFIRTFGQRLETNFWLAFEWAQSENGEPF